MTSLRTALSASLIAIALSTDWELVASRGGVPVETMCAKSEASCQAAVGAIRRGWFAADLAGAEVACRQHAGCFTEQSNCIDGFNCGASEPRQ
jgi:hypothetical protein